MAKLKIYLLEQRTTFTKDLITCTLHIYTELIEPIYWEEETVLKVRLGAALAHQVQYPPGMPTFHIGRSVPMLATPLSFWLSAYDLGKQWMFAQEQGQLPPTFSILFYSFFFLFFTPSLSGLF